MEDNAENLKLAVGLLRGLEGLKGFPKTDAGLLEAAKRFLAIVHDADMAKWLAEEIFEGCTEWPPPITMRSIYENEHIAADGKRVSAILERMERAGAK